MLFFVLRILKPLSPTLPPIQGGRENKEFYKLILIISNTLSKLLKISSF
ncbi:MAG: hypothetical protein LBQ24_03360 [Candidatus Peribacteria bacterium]|nr:hypothetical protein [Candidatus Peribacteria bacterium]